MDPNTPLPADCLSLEEADYDLLNSVEETATPQTLYRVTEYLRQRMPFDVDTAVRLSNYFVAVGACIESDVCDQELTGHLFGGDMRVFYELVGGAPDDLHQIHTARQQIGQVLCIIHTHLLVREGDTVDRRVHELEC